MPHDPNAFADMVILTVKAALHPILERVAGLESQMKQAISTDTALLALRDRVFAVEIKSAQPVPLPDVHPTDLTPVLDRLAALQERLAVVEVRAQMPGPPGKDGVDGKDGAPGNDGAPGKDGVAGLSYEGVYQEGKSYERGHVATYGSSAWHCNEPTTTKPGDGSKAWTLMVKRGRDGRDGKDAETVPVVSLGGSR